MTEIFKASAEAAVKSFNDWTEYSDDTNGIHVYATEYTCKFPDYLFKKVALCVGGKTLAVKTHLIDNDEMEPTLTVYIDGDKIYYEKGSEWIYNLIDNVSVYDPYGYGWEIALDGYFGDGVYISPNGLSKFSTDL